MRARLGRVADEPAWLDDEEMAAWLAFLEVSHRLDRVIEQQLKADAGLSHPQYEILSRLGSAPGSQQRMSDLADMITVSRSGLTYQITAAGRAALGRAAPGHVGVVRRYLIDVLTPAQRAALAGGQAAARERLRQGPGSP